MIIQKFDFKNSEAWDRFCQESDDAWFWHTSSWIEYNLVYRPELAAKSFSFFVIEGKKILAICPLILENIKPGREFSFGEIPGPVPAFANNLSKRQKERIQKVVYSEIDELAAQNKIMRASFRSAVLNPSFVASKEYPHNLLLKYGYLDSSLNTQIIEVSQPIEILRSNLRHGHDSDITRAAKVLRAEIYDQKNITRAIFDAYADLHHKAAGRVTRPQATFDMMFEFIKSGYAFLAAASKGQSFIGFSYFIRYKNNVYYGSSCNEIDVNLPITHSIQWRAIEWMHENGCKFYEIGWQQYGPTLQDFPSPKEVDISHFKRGFGGFTVPLFMGEKFYGKEYFLSIYKERLTKYAASL